MRNDSDVLRAPGKAGSRADPEDWIGVASRSSQADARADW
jgi:hypothetical protein